MKRNELAALASGLALGLAGVFVAVSLFTWDVRDPQALPNYEAPPRVVLNRGGMAGAMVSSFLFRAHGVAAFAVPVGMIGLAALFLARRSMETGLRRACGAAVVIAAVSLLAGTRSNGLLGGLMATRSVEGAGGAFGAYPVAMLTRLVGGAGTYLVILFGLGAGMLLISRRVVEGGLAAVGRCASRSGLFVAGFAGRTLTSTGRRFRRPSPEEVFESASRRARDLAGPAVGQTPAPASPEGRAPADAPHSRGAVTESGGARRSAEPLPPAPAGGVPGTSDRAADRKPHAASVDPAAPRAGGQANSAAPAATPTLPERPADEDGRADEPERITSAIPIPTKADRRRSKMRLAKTKREAASKLPSETSTRRMLARRAKANKKAKGPKTGAKRALRSPGPLAARAGNCPPGASRSGQLAAPRQSRGEEAPGGAALSSSKGAGGSRRKEAGAPSSARSGAQSAGQGRKVASSKGKRLSARSVVARLTSSSSRRKAVEETRASRREAPFAAKTSGGVSGALSGAGPEASLGARSDGAPGASSGASSGLPSGPPSSASSSDASTARGASSTGPLRGSAYRLPPVDVLLPEDLKTEVNPDEIAQRGVQIVRTLSEFQIEAKLVGCERGPATTMYELSLGPGINVNRVLALANNLAMAVMSHDVRVIAPIPGRSTIGVEVPNLRTEIVRMRPLMASEDPAFVRATAIPLLLGRDTSGAPLVSDLTAMPHLLIAGTTGSGKSVCMDAVITSILMLRRPDQVKLLLIDPKMVELSRYRDVPHLVSPVVTDVRRAAGCLEWAVREMQERYAMLSAVGGRDIGSYNGMAPGERCKRALAAGADSPERFAHQMPHVVIMVDELSDLMMQVPKEVEESMRRLAQKSRATGIHMVLATQRPSVDVITGTIRANFPCRIAFQVAVSVDSRVIIGRGGAERLLGKGDMLFVPPERANPIRAKGVYVAEEEIERVLDHIRKQPPADSRLALDERPPAGDGDGGGFPSPAGIAGRRSHEPDADELYVEAVRIVLGSRRGSVSLLQRRLGIGYTRAGKLIDMMAADGLIGPYKGSKARDIVMTLEEWEKKRTGLKKSA